MTEREVKREKYGLRRREKKCWKEKQTQKKYAWKKIMRVKVKIR